MTSFRKFLAALFVVMGATSAAGAEIPNLSIVLSVPFQARAGQDAAAAPARFVMLSDGQVFVGASDAIETCRLQDAELEHFLAELDAVRKPRHRPKRNDPGQPWLGGPTVWSFGGSYDRVVLSFAADPARQLAALRLELVGDPAAAPLGLKPLGQLTQRLLAFDHECLRPYVPSAYRMRATRGTLPGGCRVAGALAASLPRALQGTVAVPAVAAQGWPHGATVAQVCDADVRYLVTLTPLLPGEEP